MATSGASPGRDSLNWLATLLSGREVVLVPHADEAGRRWREKAEQSPRNSNCTVRVVNLPTGDLDDRFREAGDQCEALRQLVADAAPPRPGDPASELSKGDTVTSCIVKLTEAHADPLFLAPRGDAYARLPVESHREILRLEDKSFERWASDRLYDAGKAPSSTGLRAAKDILTQKAWQHGIESRLHNRVAWHQNDLWCDLSDRQWGAVGISRDGWEIVDDPPVLFHRYPHMTAQVEPARNGEFERLLEFVNIRERDHLLFCTYGLSCFVPDIAHPVALFVGPQGSAETCTARYLRRVIDRSQLTTQSFPRKEADLMQGLDHQWVAVFGNVTRLSASRSDALCRAWRTSRRGGLPLRRHWATSNRTSSQPTSGISTNTDTSASRATRLRRPSSR